MFTMAMENQDFLAIFMQNMENIISKEILNKLMI